MLGTSLLCMPAAMLHAGLILGTFLTVNCRYLTQCKRFNNRQRIAV